MFQDGQASYDVNDHDPDPMPRYDYTNENRYHFFKLGRRIILPLKFMVKWSLKMGL